jgi:DNA primase
MNVSELLTKNGIHYTDKGKDVLVRCLSPDHEDRNPSMRIDKTTGIGYCFSCGFKLDLFKHFGVIKNTNSILVSKVKGKIENLYKKEPQQYPRGTNFVEKPFRGISIETLTKFHSFTCELSGWEGRIWFPIQDIFGDIVCFQGRYIGSELTPKYIFYPKHVSPPVFPNGKYSVLGSLIVVEGIFDLLRLWDCGITNVVCSFGLSVSAKYDKIFEAYKIMGIHTLIPLFDNDTAGNRAIKDFTKLYKDDFNIKTHELPFGKDPFDLSTNEINILKKELNI